MPGYHYKCPNCLRTYFEYRDISHAQSFTHCQLCNIEFQEYTPEQ